jgi:ATP-dependent DNA ligase
LLDVICSRSPSHQLRQLYASEGILSKRRDRPYQAGRSKDWIKVKHRKRPAMERVMEQSFT